MKLILGDCLDKLKDLEDNSVDSIVTDPPYGLSFMGKKWDYDVPSVEIWKECLRVLKPGAMLLSFAGSRTYHRIAINIEDAGFEIRDQIMWIYGSGFPKSHNIGKAVDKLEGNEREFIEKGISGAKETHKTYNMAFEEGKTRSLMGGEYNITKRTSQWEGWGTALKPAHEPIVVARKPLGEKTVAKNVLKYGTGGINIDGCRVGMSEEDAKKTKNNWKPENGHDSTNTIYKNGIKELDTHQHTQGRFPANIIFDEEAGKILDEQSGISKSNKLDGSSFKVENNGDYKSNVYGKYKAQNTIRGHTDKGGASRFFYCAKASKSDRNEGCEDLEKQSGIRTNAPRKNEDVKTPSRKNNHPTVKPTKLMQYLVRLVTPKGAVCLDPFMGSGSTGKACILEEIDFIGIEMDENYMEIAKKRIDAVFLGNDVIGEETAQ